MSVTQIFQRDAVKLAELLRVEAERLRILALKALTRAGSGHPGGSLSLAEVMSVLYFGGVLRYDPQNPHWRHRDRLILGEGHAVPIQYAALVEAAVKGWSMEALMDLRQRPDVIAQGHATRGTPGIDCSTGALGMSGAKSVGMAIAERYRGMDYHTFDILGDGEFNEGEVYEAAQNAGLLGLDNLTWIVNRNKAQQTAGIWDLSAVRHEKMLESCGWNVLVLNGESSDPERNRTFITQLRNALLAAKADRGKAKQPTAIVVDTIKGKGVDFMEFKPGVHKPGDYKFHGVAPKPEELERAIPQIEARLTGTNEEEMLQLRRSAGISPEAKQAIEAANALSMKEAEDKKWAIRRAAGDAPRPVYKAGDKPASTREGFGKALAFLARNNLNILATSPDLQDSVQMFSIEKVAGRHSRDNPWGAYIPEGVAEANACGKCAGLGLEGLIAFMGTFDNFLLEATQELNHAAQFGSFYIAVGTHSGCGIGPDGKSQMGIVSPGVIDQLSGAEADLFEIYEPADAGEAAALTIGLVERFQREGLPNHPIYLRCTRHPVEILDTSSVADYEKKIFEGSYVACAPALPALRQAQGGEQSRTAGRPAGPQHSHDVILAASGAVVLEALQAAKTLAGEGIRAKVINVVSLNKIQKEASPFVKEQLEDGVPIVTAHDAEPHALGHRVKDAVNTARLLGRNPGAVVKTLGVDASPNRSRVGSGTSQENYRRNAIDAAGIAAAVKEVLKR